MTQTRGPCRQGPLQTKQSYRQGVLTYKGAPIDKGAQKTKGPHRQGVPTDNGPLQQMTAIDDVDTDKGVLQTIWGPYRQSGVPTDKGLYRQGYPTDQRPLQTRDLYRRCAISTNNGPPHDIQARLQMTPQTGIPYRTRGSYRRCTTGKGPLQTRDPYMIYKQGAPTDKGLHTSKGT